MHSGERIGNALTEQLVVSASEDASSGATDDELDAQPARVAERKTLQRRWAAGIIAWRAPSAGEQHGTRASANARDTDGAVTTTLEEINALVGKRHDAVLLSIDMLWAEGTVTLGFRTASGPKQIVVEEVTRLECPREYPWGRSVCINEVRLGSSPPGGGFRVEMEMQSGDVLVIHGSSVRAEQSSA